MKKEYRLLMITCMVVLLCFFAIIWAGTIENQEDQANLQKIADDLKESVTAKNFKILRAYAAEASLFFGPCVGDEDPKNLMYSFDEISRLFREHTKDAQTRLNAMGFSVGFDEPELMFEAVGGVPNEYRYLYFLFEKTKEGWKWTGICHFPIRERSFKPSQEFK